MRFSEISFLALSAMTVVSGHKQYHKSTLKTSPSLLVPEEPKTLHKGLAVGHQLMARQGSAGDSDFCSGYGATCQSCFGPDYIECSDGVTCYDPNDPSTSCDDSSSGSGSGGSGSGSDGSGSGSSGGSDGGSSDYCYGESCSSCFGPGYIECSDGTDCYDPSDSSTYCPSDGTGSGSGSDGSGSGSEATTTFPSTPTSTSGLGSIGDLPSVTTSTGSSMETSSSGSSSGDSGSSSSSGDSGSSGSSSGSSGNTPDSIAPGLSIPMGLSVGLGGAVLAAIAVM